MDGLLGLEQAVGPGPPQPRDCLLHPHRFAALRTRARFLAYAHQHSRDAVQMATAALFEVSDTVTQLLQGAQRGAAVFFPAVSPC